MNRLQCVAVVTALFLVPSCGNKAPGVVKRDGKPDVVQSFDKAKMDAAMAEAKSTLDTFVTVLEKRPQGATNFAIKKGFKHGDDETEWLWISGVQVDGDGFSGKVGNDPLHDIGVKLGDSIKVSRAEVVDWMYLANRKLQGGYTIVALAHGTERQATAEKQMGIDWSKYEFLKKKK